MQNISWQQENADRTIFIKGEHSSSQGRVHKFGFDQSIKDPLRVKRIAFALPVIVQCINRGDPNFPALNLCSVMKVALGNSVSYLMPDDFDLVLRSKRVNVMAEACIWQCESGTCTDHLETSMCRDLVVAAGSSATRVP